MTQSLSAAAAAVTIVVQTRVKSEKTGEFAAWQQKIGRAAAEFPGFIRQSVLPPSPPIQVDWVILQTFESTEAATNWLNSEVRLELLSHAQPMLVGQDDVHIVKDGASGVLPAPVSAVISTRVKPGCEGLYRAWEQRIAAAQAKAPGFQGYRFEPPMPGVQTDWVAILRFDCEANLKAWLNSPARRKLVDESAPFTEEYRIRTVRGGFDQWFANKPDQSRPPVWKQNMLVLLMLYPVVFLFGVLVQQPLLMDRAELPFWLALFIGNVASVILLNWLVPFTSRRFAWWLHPGGRSQALTNLAGVSIVIGLYAASLLIFARFPR
ncbi:MAG TPA: antibiotic biosynthesis monooxygenase [Stellaceae bacterium]|nr:antibiotic biosynthesis monooxygenase [Stellaceae bacterium]